MSDAVINTPSNTELSGEAPMSPSAQVTDSLQRHALLGRRTKKRWSFHDSARPNLVGRPPGGGRQRRLSDVTGADGVHKAIALDHISPAQLYLTESGRLFHAGKICIALAGLPGRGKTHLLVALTRYLRWLGVKTHSFHLCDYRRAARNVPAPKDPKSAEGTEDDVFPGKTSLISADIESLEPENETVGGCLNDILNFFESDCGQVAVYDAVNAHPEARRRLDARFRADGIQCIFIELTVTDPAIVLENIASAARLLPDYVNWDYATAHADYSQRIAALAPSYQEMSALGADADLSFIKLIDFGRRIELNNSNYGYLINKVVFFLMNSHIKRGSVYFARCYKNDWDYASDPPLDAAGVQYARNLAETVLLLRAEKGRSSLGLFLTNNAMRRTLSTDQKHPPTGADGVDDDSFVVWTSVKRRTIETTQPFRERGIPVRHRIQLSQRNPGVVAGLSDDEIRQRYPSEYELYLRDSYHHRFSRAELYHDLAIKIEPLILEMERMSGDILIIADETVLRVLHGYLMACSCYDIPWLEFSMDDIIEVNYNAYANTARRIPIKDFTGKIQE